MLQAINPVTTSAWQKLEQHYAIMKDNHMVDMFAVDPSRFATFSLHFENILVDFSKNIINDQTIAAFGVGHGFLSGKRFGSNHEQGGFGVYLL